MDSWQQNSLFSGTNTHPQYFISTYTYPEYPPYHHLYSEYPPYHHLYPPPQQRFQIYPLQPQIYSEYRECVRLMLSMHTADVRPPASEGLSYRPPKYKNCSDTQPECIHPRNKAIVKSRISVDTNKYRQHKYTKL